MMSSPLPNPAKIFLTDDNGFYSGDVIELAPGQKPPVEPIVDHVEGYGGKGVDAVSFDFCGGQMLSYPTKAGDPHPGLSLQYAEAGIDLAEIIEKTCHHVGVQFWMAARMNASLIYQSDFHAAHPIGC